VSFSAWFSVSLKSLTLETEAVGWIIEGTDYLKENKAGHFRKNS
jgi:hypothetical protein